MKRTPLRRKPQDDAVSEALWNAVWIRDVAVAGGCVARHLGAPGECRNVWGDPANDSMGNPLRSAMTVDHVPEGYSTMGKRAPSDMSHLVLTCYAHHLGGWSTSHRPELREYLEKFRRAA